MKRLVVLVGTLIIVFAGAKLALAGPIIIDGADANDHGICLRSGRTGGSDRPRLHRIVLSCETKASFDVYRRHAAMDRRAAAARLTHLN